MKIGKSILLFILLASLLAFAVSSQQPQSTSISLEEKKSCITRFYDEVQPIIGNCIHYYNYTRCLNITGPNTGCSLQQAQISYSCKTGEIIIKKNSTECKPLDKFVVTANNGALIQKKEIDFSSWGTCVNNTENGCLAITCGTLKGGSARNGIFNGCDGGKQCQKFIFCGDGTKILYKAARNSFVSQDPTFRISPLEIKEVGE
ncbi:hypothetical protein HYS31_06090 [Candidatus Woesearchaeota archaeon]|nr:hypothetical protein [Candidatus Woesearchaeota archaeon]